MMDADNTEWVGNLPWIRRRIGAYRLAIYTRIDPGTLYWSVITVETPFGNLRATGRSRTVSAAKAACMRAMNRHRKESQP